ncbi:hypothetical protein GCM10027592_56590 [Spirosoma flavus]
MKSFTNLVSPKVLWVIYVLSFYLYSCSRNKDDFARQLAVDFVDTINQGSATKERTLISPASYENESKGLSIALNGVNMFDIPFIRDGLIDGYRVGGQVFLKNYPSAYGRFTAQQLDIEQLLHVKPKTTNQIDYIVIHLKGQLQTNEGPIAIDYKFSYSNPSTSAPFDLNTIELVSGTIQAGTDIYDVKLGTHTTSSEVSATPDSIDAKNSSGVFDTVARFFSDFFSSEKHITVDSSTQHTNIELTVGDKITFRANGTILLGLFAGSTGPDGIDGFGSYSKVPEFKHGSLIGRIGNGDWFIVGSKQEIVAQTAGELQLQVNDDDSSNNSGSFSVDYQIE